MAKILLVDDSKTLLMCIKRMLMDGGHEVVATATGRLAVEHLATSPVDLVLTDLYMPPPDGFEIVHAVRELPEQPPIIVMSSNTLACDVFRDARALGAAAVLQKPFDAPKLLATIEDVLTKARRAVVPMQDAATNSAEESDGELLRSA